MFYKRGLSPLIATVLLIAFAVALGVMVMNWGKSAAIPKTETPGCEDVKFDTYSFDKASLLCFNPSSYSLRTDSAEYQLCTKK